MISLLLAIIYISFISLGLPDSLLGSAWPAMHTELKGVELSFAGIITMIISAGTVISSLQTDKLMKRLGIGLVTSLSVLTTAVALFGFSVSGEFWMLCVFAVPYGLGAGAIDAALNNYVALHFSSRHMNWLHCCWGVGAAISPYIMSCNLTSGAGWNAGYRSVAFIQIILTAILFISLPLWKIKRISAGKQEQKTVLKLRQILKIKGVKFILPAFFAYCAMEATAYLWASSYLVIDRGIDAETAARYASLFFIGITTGRFLCGIISNKVGDRNMIRLGFTVTLLGIMAVWLPVSVNWLCLNGLIIIGFGCAPVYPAVIHATPDNFGKENAQAIIGVQMASAYIGITFMPPLFGLLANYITISLYPYFLLFFALMMFFMTEKLNKLNVKKPLANKI